MRITKPIVIFDLETTSADVDRAKIIEFGAVKLEPDGSRSELHIRVNPQIPIDPGATEVHHITNQDVEHEPHFSEIAYKIYGFIKDCDISGYNLITFDFPILTRELSLSGFTLDHDTRVIDLYHVFRVQEPNTLSRAYQVYCDKKMDDSQAHGALYDAQVTVEVLLGQCKRYVDPGDTDAMGTLRAKAKKPNWVDGKGQFQWDDAGEVIFTFGKYRGTPVAHLARTKPDYLLWMLKQDFSQEVKDIVSSALKNKIEIDFPKPTK